MFFHRLHHLLGIDLLCQPALLKHLDKTKRDLEAAFKPEVEPLLKLDTPFEALPKTARDVILYGSGEDPIKFSYDDGLRAYDVRKPFEGVVSNLQRRYLETECSRAILTGRVETLLRECCRC